MTSKIFIADYSDPQQARDIGVLLNSYALDPMGGGVALSEQLQSTLAEELSKVAGAFTVLSYVEGKAAGLVNCFQGFSTFQCRPIINIHDVAVEAQFRGQGLSQQMLTLVEQEAVRRGCCKLTLEVLAGNTVARNAYLKLGFAGYELDPAMGQAEFWEKKIAT